MILSDKEKIDLLLKTLIDTVGTDDPKELDAMELFLRTAEIPNRDKMITINAIDAIRIVKECL